MKNRLLFWFIIGGLVLSGCIDDTSKMANKILSNITIESAQDTFLVEFGEEVRIVSKASQDLEGQELQYEWKSQYLSRESGKDSLKLLPSKDPILSDIVSFRQLGAYKVRLRVSNEDGSSFHNYIVIVRSTYDNGLLVLSKDENKKGRLAFLRVLQEDELLTSDVKMFKTNVFADVNPGISLTDPIDMTFWKQKKEILFSLADNVIRYCDQSLAYLYPLTWENPLKLGRFYTGSEPYILTAEKGVFLLDDDAIYKTVWSQASVTKGCDCPITIWGEYMDNVMFIDFKQSRIYTDRGGDTGDLFVNKDIVNVALNMDCALIVLADKNNPKKLTISFKTFDGLGSLAMPDYTYETDKITLTKDFDVVSESMHSNTAFYAVGPDLYRWITSGLQPELPTFPALTVEGEITCLTLSRNYRYLYIGIYNPSSTNELKGSVWIMDVESLKIVKRFDGIADKPVKMLYKENQ